MLVYIAGYIVNKLLKVTGPEGPCKDCKLLATHVPSDDRYSFLKGKQYADLQLGVKGLKVPRTELVDVMVALESNFLQNIACLIHSDGLGQRLFHRGMKAISDCREVVCQRDKCRKSLEYIVKLFNRIRVHHVLRVENQRLVQPKQKRNRKVVVLTHQ